MTPTDQTVKWRIVYLTAALSLVGFLLEIGPVCGVFPLAMIGLRLDVLALGFLAYLALAASAAVGLHLGEEEPTAKEETSSAEPETPKPVEWPRPVGGDGESVGERVAVRPELHQLRMIFTALAGYTILKGISLTMMWPAAYQSGLTFGKMVRLFQFGFIFIALGWLLLWQFLRWYAYQRRWIRLQEELVGADVSRIVAFFILLNPVIYLVTAIFRRDLTAGPLSVLSFLLHLALLAMGLILWGAQPTTLKRTLVRISVTGGIIALLTLILFVVEYIATS